MPGATAMFHAHAAGVTILAAADGSLRVAPRERITPELRKLLTEHRDAVHAAALPRATRHTQVSHRGQCITFKSAAALPGEPVRVGWTQAGKTVTTIIPNTSAAFVALAERIQDGSGP